MNALTQARRGYAAANVPTRTTKSIEYDAIARITCRLRDAALAGKAGFPALAEALHDNRRLWTIFAAEVADRANPLPQALKAQLFYLAEFTERHSRSVLAGTAQVTPLLEINAAVLRGLRGEEA